MDEATNAEGLGKTRQEILLMVEDQELSRIIKKHTSDYDFSSDLREAFVLLENRIRERTGLPLSDFGKELIEKAFNPTTGVLQPVSSLPAERAGLNDFLRGLFLFYRNPVAHRATDYALERPLQVISLIDHALTLVEYAAATVLKVSNFVGRHEGMIKRRRDFRLDIDKDGEIDIVSMVELSPVLDDGVMIPHMIPVILNKINGNYSRIMAEGIRGQTIYGPLSVTIRFITDRDLPNIVLCWAWGETQVIYIVLRKKGDEYIIARREYPAETTEPYSGPTEKMFNCHSRQLTTFVDVDGDGLEEIVQELLFDDSDLRGMGYGPILDGFDQQIAIARVHKWDEAKERIVQILERPVAR